MMALTYNGINLAALGEISVTQSEQFDPPENPHRKIVSLKAKIDVFQSGFSDNYGLIRQLKEALRVQHGVLVWSDTTTGQEWLNRTVEVISNDMPEDPNAWGSYFQSATVSFSYTDTNLVTNSQGATFKNNDSGQAVDLGAVNKFSENYSTKHISEYRDQRERVNGAVTLSGYLLVSTDTSLATRRTALLARRAELRAALTGAFGRLVYADFSNNVRVETSSFEIDQLVNGLNWSVSANFTKFPDESGYATVDFDVAQSEDVEAGEVRLNFSGRVQAADKLTAKTKLDLVRKGVLGLYGFSDTATQRLTQELKDKWVSNADDPAGNIFAGTADTSTSKAWIELSFTEVYRRRRYDILSWNLQVQTRDDIRSGLVLTTFSGEVICAAASMSDARTLAVNKALSLVGAPPTPAPSEDKSFLVSSSLTYHIRQLNQTVAGSPPAVVPSSGSPQEFLRLEFSYEYQSKIADGRVYCQISESTSVELFGGDSWDISGFVVATTRAAADTAYVTLVKARDFYTGRLVRNEKLSEDRQTAKSATGAYLSGLHATGDTGGTGFQFIKLDFSFQAFKPKAPNQFGIRYSVEISRDFRQFEKIVTVSGSVFGSAPQIRAMAYGAGDVSAEVTTSASFLDQFLLFTLKLSHPVSSRRSIDVEWKPGTWTSGTPSVTATGSVEGVAKVDFSESYELPLPPDALIVDSEVTESVSYSCPRFVVKNLPGPIGHQVALPMETAQSYSGANQLQSVSIVQECGLDPGRRTVRGSVTAATLSTAETWARAKRLLLTGYYPLLLMGDGSTQTSGVKCFYPLQPQIETAYSWRPRISGAVGPTRFGGVGTDRQDVGGDSANVRMYKVSFTYEEILPYYPMT